VPIPTLLQGAVVAGLLFAQGWQTAAGWIGGWIAGFIAEQIVEILFIRSNAKATGMAFTSSEINFFNAYRLHADRLGLTRDITVSHDEIASGLWEKCLDDYGTKCPEAVARFSAR